MFNLTDEQLVEQHKNGDPTAFEQLYARYSKLVNSFSRSFFLTGGDENDLKQEGMLGLFYAINNYNACKGKFSSFAYLCIRSRVLNAVSLSATDKHRALNSSVPISAFDDNFEYANGFSPENILIGNENLKELIEKIKAVLSHLELKVFNCYIEGLNYREIAYYLNVDTKRVDNALCRIKSKSKKII